MTPTTLAQAADQARDLLGTVLFTVTVLTPDGGEISRVYSSHPEVYAVGGRKRTDPSQTSPIWSEQVISGQRPFLGADRTAVREFFFDWETIEALGCGAIVNAPVVHGGETIASINFLGPEGSLDEASVPVALDIVRDATPAVVAARAAAFPELAS
ncbi:GAF domain-containing protein [Agromyces aerolatus]|uniref:GAF domain-containing protein n=1 Tax=Agromyces sp. LY-1074 TaxID=3074080 RepID=UPI002857DC2E|nr:MULTISPECIES: GAF domain-containing protein [unclassified Agromyces]MDR5701128.1 GAF domain-containing protein [Agromyces sp. LY-1074]MDR5707768.1 GAF domain-containing protein [Agromyces sp. LY-1358]